jgi:hypothetical protein
MCLRYVSFQTAWQGPCGELRQAVSSFLNYAASSWYQHANVSKPSDGEMVRFANAFVNESNKQWRSWAKWFDLNTRGETEESQKGNPRHPVPSTTRHGFVYRK